LLQQQLRQLRLQYLVVSHHVQGIDRVMQRVKSMYEPVELVMFNVFDYTNAADWKAVKAAFYADNEDIKVGGWGHCAEGTAS
jgi:hypothetical protein